MVKSQIIQTIVLDEEVHLTFIEICEQLNLPENVLEELIDHGLLQEVAEVEIKQSTTFDAAQLARIQTALRLGHDLGINIPGVVLALELLDEIEQLRQELSILKRLRDM